MRTVLHNAWRQVLLIGILSVIFGIISLIWPGITLVSLVYLFSFIAIMQGLSLISGAWNSRSHDKSWFWLLLLGIVYVIAAITCLLYPGVTALFLIILIGIQAIFLGIIEIVAAIRLRKEIKNEGWLIFSGALSLLFGLWVIDAPGAGALALIWLIAIYAIVYGIAIIMLAMRARNWLKDIAPAAK